MPVLEKTLESPLDNKEGQPIHPKGNQSRIFIETTDAEAETPMLWPPDAKNWLIGKDPDAGKDWRQEEKGMTEDEMVGWHHRLDGHESELTLGVGDGQGDLACCSPMGSERVGHDWATELNWTAYPFSRRSSRLRNQTGVSCIAGGFFTSWAAREAHKLPTSPQMDTDRLWDTLL